MRSTAAASTAVVVAALLALTTNHLVANAQQDADDEDYDCVTSLASESILTRTCVDYMSSIGTDLREIQEALFQDPPDVNTATDIYTQGKYAYEIDNDGNPTNTRRTIQSMSTSLGDMMAAKKEGGGDSTYNFILYGLADKQVESMDEYATFANDYVLSLLQDPDGDGAGPRAWEAMVVLNIYTYATYLLWDIVHDCEQASSNIVTNSLVQPRDRGIQSLDEFIALYIGDDQVSAEEDGYSLYALAQIAGDYFNTANPLANVNNIIMEQYQQSTSYLLAPDACTPGSRTVELLHLSVINIISQINVVFMQQLIRALYHEDQDMIALYAQIVIPQLSACKHSTYTYLKYHLLDNPSGYDPDMFNEIYGKLTTSFECMGYTCDDIGVYLNGNIGKCANVPSTLPLAGYTPASPVHRHATIDLDLIELDGLLSMGLYTSAQRLYKYGKHSTKGSEENDDLRMRTLEDMATSSNRQLATPYYELYKDYDNDDDYAHTIIMAALTSPMTDGAGKYGSMSVGARKEIIMKTIQYQVLYMYALYEFRDAVRDCRANDITDNDSDDDVTAFDEGAAFLIGSLEGITVGGDDITDGMLHYNLGQVRAEEFGTDVAPDNGIYAAVNEELIDLLWAGRAALNTMACDEVSRIVDKIQQITLIPLFQSVIKYAVVNSGAGTSKNEETLALGETYARSILPLVNDRDANAANIITKNMLMEEGIDAVQDGPQAVANAIRVVCDSDTYQYIHCSHIGSFDGIDVRGTKTFMTSDATTTTVGGVKMTMTKSFVWGLAFAMIGFGGFAL